VGWGEEIDVLFGGHHALRDRFIALAAEHGIKPDDLVTTAFEFLQFCIQNFSWSCIVAITHNDRDRAGVGELPGVVGIEFRERFPDTRAARPTLAYQGHFFHHLDGVGLTQRSGDVNQPRVENEGLRPRKTSCHRMDEAHEEQRLGVHGTRYVDEQDKRDRRLSARFAKEPKREPASLHTAAKCAPEIKLLSSAACLIATRDAVS